ncbi:hypothetical protein LCGC14_0509380 [marine sediment metagenome]|uniref:Uncharacterized protein n=1 Tax=marine sediment metagenome TaxID=412755 RepID=A0A0F9SK21_9ZZZZ|nr:hypothetical protein [bacterium]
MTNGASAIIGTVPTFQALALVGENVKVFKKKKKLKSKDFIKLGAKNIIGVNLIKLTAQQASLV